ncbi:MAG: ferredoxin family protein [Alphaproteobacteria bacterium]|nr:ferredoxin family protein [Alphaproteobacteria bacterium]
MPFVVAEPCVKCKYTDCVEVCPVDCFHEGENMLVIDPVECIDCGACVPECPAEAIYLDEDLPAKWAEYEALNARLAEKWPVLSGAREPLPDADDWKGRSGKRGELSEAPGAGD